MKILLAALASEPGQGEANLTQLGATMRDHAGLADLVVVAEAFGQGFEALTDDPTHDLAMAWTIDGPELAQVRRWAATHHMAVCLGFFERDGSTLHSSAAVIDAHGELVTVYRRISSGWRFPDADTSTYVDGSDIVTFTLADKLCTVALCGDLWVLPERFAAAQADIALWPVFVNYEPGAWASGEMDEYAHQVADVADHVLLVNSLSSGSPASPAWGGATHGGAVWFSGGAVRAELPMGEAGVLLVDVP